MVYLVCRSICPLYHSFELASVLLYYFCDQFLLCPCVGWTWPIRDHIKGAIALFLSDLLAAILTSFPGHPVRFHQCACHQPHISQCLPLKTLQVATSQLAFQTSPSPLSLLWLLFTSASFFSFKLFIYICLFIWPHQVLVVACRIFSCGTWDLVPWPGVEAGLPALGAQNLNHWITREVPYLNIFIFLSTLPECMTQKCEICSSLFDFSLCVFFAQNALSLNSYLTIVAGLPQLRGTSHLPRSFSNSPLLSRIGEFPSLQPTPFLKTKHISVLINLFYLLDCRSFEGGHLEGCLLLRVQAFEFQFCLLLAKIIVFGPVIWLIEPIPFSVKSNCTCLCIPSLWYHAQCTQLGYLAVDFFTFSAHLLFLQVWDADSWL